MKKKYVSNNFQYSLQSSTTQEEPETVRRYDPTNFAMSWTALLTIFPAIKIIHRGRKGINRNNNISQKINSIKQILQVFLKYYILEEPSSWWKPQTYLARWIISWICVDCGGGKFCVQWYRGRQLLQTTKITDTEAVTISHCYIDSGRVIVGTI